MKTKLEATQRIASVIAIAIITLALVGLSVTGCGGDDKPATGSETFTVTFNANGGSPTPTNQTIEKGKTVSEPQAPTKSDYDFIGWYKETALTNQWNFATDTVNADIILWAKWSDDNAEKERSTAINLSFGELNSHSATITGKLTKVELDTAAGKIRDELQAIYGITPNDEVFVFPSIFGRGVTYIVEKSPVGYTNYKTVGDGKTLYISLAAVNGANFFEITIDTLGALYSNMNGVAKAADNSRSAVRMAAIQLKLTPSA